mgnify:CR=1 FL=1
MRKERTHARQSGHSDGQAGKIRDKIERVKSPAFCVRGYLHQGLVFVYPFPEILSLRKQFLIEADFCRVDASCLPMHTRLSAGIAQTVATLSMRSESNIDSDSVYGIQETTKIQPVYIETIRTRIRIRIICPRRTG